MKLQNKSASRRQPASRSSVTLSTTHLDRIINLAEFIQSHPGSKYSIRQFARLALINDYDLKKMFRYVHGKTIHAFQIEQRLIEARWLLVSTARSIAEIANCCGYRPDYFTILFGTKIGLTPTEFRKRKFA